MMTNFERNILKRVIDNTDKKRRIDINSVHDISQARTLNIKFRKDPEMYRNNVSIPLRSLKTDIENFWEKYINTDEKIPW